MYDKNNNDILLTQYAMEADPQKKLQIRNQIIVNNQGLCKKVAINYLPRCTSFTLHDLINEGNIGLMRAIEKYDSSKGMFSTYAVYYIQATITKAIDDKDRIIRIPVDKINLIRKYRYLLDYNYSSADACKELDVTQEKMSILLAAYNSLGSLDELINSDNTEDIYLADIISDNNICVEDAALKKSLQTNMQEVINYFGLTQNEKTILSKYYGFETGQKVSLKEIGNQLGLSIARIDQIEKKAVRKLRYAYGWEKKGLKEYLYDTTIFDGLNSAV